VPQFFVRTPCRSLALAVDDGRGNAIAVSIAWARTPGADSAGRMDDAARLAAEFPAP
jgi:hypothetical protein